MPILCGAPSLGAWSPERPWKVPEEIGCSPGGTWSQCWRRTHLEARGTSPVALPVSGAAQLVGGGLHECLGCPRTWAGPSRTQAQWPWRGQNVPGRRCPDPSRPVTMAVGYKAGRELPALGTQAPRVHVLTVRAQCSRWSWGTGSPGAPRWLSGPLHMHAWPLLQPCSCTRARQGGVAPGLMGSGFFLHLSDSRLGPEANPPRPLSPGGLCVPP